VECVVDELAQRLGLDPIELRLKNAARQGTRAAYGPKFGPIGLVETLQAARSHEHWRAPLGKHQGRGVASGFWFNIGGDTSVSLQLNEDGTLSLTAGTPDIGGLRASLCMMAAEELGVEFDRIRVQIGDTGQLGYNMLTGGSRSTFSSGMATVEAAREVKREACRRAARLWELPEDAVEYSKGAVRPAGANAGKHAPMTLGDIAAIAGKTGGPIAGDARLTAQGAAPSFATHIADVEVDPETGKVTVLRYTAIQDAGRAIHPSYVEGQFQGGVAQGIGWALNEEYIYGPDGRLQNPGFLDYRVPVASDLPMIDTVIVEVPNPRHPYGVRGVGETSIVPPLAAIANAVAAAMGVRLAGLPMSPPKVLAALEQARAVGLGRT
jgi:CO/xanthine dehydrogenase Mo-binding subunit